MAYIYIASNCGLKDGLLKIGTSSCEPSARLAALSRSTSVPGEFELEFSVETEQASKIENRVHSLLKGRRFRRNKEFFSISVVRAIEVVNEIVEYSSLNENIATEIGKHDDLLWSTYEPKLILRELQLMNLIMAATNFVMLRHALRFEADIVDGFLDSATVSARLAISKASATSSMRKIAEKGERLKINFIGREGGMQVFEDINYHRGELWWLFNEEFLFLFQNNKI